MEKDNKRILSKTDEIFMLKNLIPKKGDENPSRLSFNLLLFPLL